MTPQLHEESPTMLADAQEKIRRQQVSLTILTEAGEHLLAGENPVEIIQGLFASISANLQLDIFSYHVMIPDGTALRLEASSGLPPELSRYGMLLPLGECVSGVVAQRRSCLTAQDVLSSDDPMNAGPRRLGIQCYAAYPLIAKDVLLGTLFFASRERGSLHRDELEFLRTVCHYVASAKERVRLLREVTERAQSLTHKDQSLQLALSAARMFAWKRDLASSEVNYSPTAIEVLGLLPERAALNAEEIFGLMHPDDVETHKANIQQAIDTGDDYLSHIRMLRPDNGEIVWIESRGKVKGDLDGKPSVIEGVAIDITERKLAEIAMQEATQRREEFLANISHELRTPMNAVIGLANILGMSRPLTEKQQQFIETLQVSAQSLLELINDMLDISKMENEQVVLESVAFRASEVIEEVASILSVKAKEKGITLKSRLLGIEDPLYLGDPRRLKQALLNLVANSVKFTESGGVSIEQVSGLPDEEGRRALEIRVVDTGIGIPPGKLDAIFGKFMQADNSITRKYGGTGLGLAITKRLVEVMGGEVSVTSTEGIGSTFALALRLPTAALDEQHDGAQMLSLAVGGASRSLEQPVLLLVEDNEANILVATALLKQFGFEHEVARNGIEALEHLDRKRYDLILMDVQMPGMGGLETTAIIREREAAFETPRVPILGITAHALAGNREKCLAAGMDAYLSKPFQPDELLQLLTRLLDPQAARRAS